MTPAPRVRSLPAILFLVLAAILASGAASVWSLNRPETPPGKAKSKAGSAKGAAKAPAERPADPAEEILRANNLGIAYLAQYKPAEAEKQFRRTLEIQPDYVVGLVNLGIAALAQVHYDDAVAAFRKALERDPDNIYAHFNLSLIHKLQGRPAEALVEALAALKQDPRDPDVHYHVGTLHMTQRDLDKAIQSFERVLAIDPNFLSAYYSLGRAWITKGDMEKGKRYIERHRELQSGAGATPAVGLKYGEQGKYSYAMEDIGSEGPATALEKGRVTLVDVTDASGITFTHAGSADLGLLRKPPAGADLLKTMAPAVLGSGVAVGDVNGDGREDLFFCNAGREGAAASELYINEGGMKFQKAGAGAPAASGQAMSAAFGDLDSDADLDLVVAMADRVLLFLNDGKGSFQDATAASGLAGAASSGMLAGVSLADVEHDGDLDIFVAGFLGRTPPRRPSTFPQEWPGGRSLLFINGGGPASGEGSRRVAFTESAAATRLDHAGRRATGAVFGDYDNDRDIDAAIAAPADGTSVYANLRDGTFGDVGPKTGLPGAATIMGLVSGDYNKDGWMDLAATAMDGGPPRLLRNMLGSIPANATGAGMFAADITAMARMTSQLSVPQMGVAFADIDNDGYIDLLSANATTQGPALFLYRQDGGGNFDPANELTGLDAIPARGGRALAAADLDQDGDLDLVLTNAGQRPTILRNDGGNASHWVRVAPAGLHSNRPGVGTKVEVKSGRLWQKTEVAAGSGYLSQGSLVPHFGLGPRERVDSVRLLWPGGVLQDEVQVKADSQLAVQELDRKGSSCPILYAWDGRRMSFVSDFLGGAALGYRTSPKSFNHPDTDEAVRIRGGQLQERDGLLSLRMVNQLEETIFFDQARLLAVDHPPGTEMFPDEKLLPAPPFQPFRVHLVQDARPPRAVRDDTGRDVLDSVSRVDRDYAGAPAEVIAAGGRRFRGYAPEHHLTIDLGDPADGAPLLLLLYGWIDYADSTSNVAAAQAGMTLVPPWLEALDESRGGQRWVRVLPDMGFPGGLPKHMTVDLTGLLPPGSHVVRIGTSMRIFWDQILVATPVSAVPAITAVDAVSAVLRLRGFPALSLPDGRRPEEYDYDRDEPSTHWKRHVGAYTRYGDVAPLLTRADDRYVITSPGDEVAIDFPARALPPVPAGWTRDYLLLADGFGKDMDVNSARPDTVGPLPWHAMSAYPPPAREASPFDAPGPFMEWQELYNTRIISSPLLPLAPPVRR